MRKLGLGFRAKYVAGEARIVAAGDLDLFALREADYDEALAALLELPGVGDKVGNCILLMSLDKREASPVDLWIDRALREWYPEHVIRADGKPLTRAAMWPWAQSYFGEYAGYAIQYLFQGRRLLKKGGGKKCVGRRARTQGPFIIRRGNLPTGEGNGVPSAYHLSPNSNPFAPAYPEKSVTFPRHPFPSVRHPFSSAPHQSSFLRHFSPLIRPYPASSPTLLIL